MASIIPSSRSTLPMLATCLSSSQSARGPHFWGSSYVPFGASPMEGIGCYLIFVVMWSILGLWLQVTESLNLFSMLFSLTSAMGRNMMIHVTFYDIPWESMGMCGSLATGTTWGYQHKPTGYKQKKLEEIPWLEPSKVGFASQSLSQKSVANLCCSCKDYDELVTGQRREGQFTMARDLVPKICEIPADALPFLLMSCSFASQWDHGLDTFQPNRELVTSTSQTAHCKPPLQTSCERFRVGKSWITFLLLQVTFSTILT